MLRYFAMVWNKECPKQRQAVHLVVSRLRVAADWESVLESPGSQVFCRDERPRSPKCYRLTEHSGVVLGTLFKKAPGVVAEFSPCGATLSQLESTRILRTRGRHLIDSYWGSYVAILTESSESKTWVVNSPMSTVPCLTAEFEGVQLYFSQMSDTIPLGLLSFSVNWKFLARSFARLTQPEETGLNEVSRLSSGECDEIHRGRISRQVYWDILSVAASGAINDVEEATSTLRNVTKACVHAWASCHDSILLQLSGGLDSSIVLGCLQDAPSHPRIIGVVNYSKTAESDEREFARMAARRAECELIELARDPSFKVEQMLQATPTEKPQPYLIHLGQGNLLVKLARDMDCSVIFSGDGGDEVFFNGEPCLSVADYVREQGINAGLLDAALSASRLTGLSVWKILRQSLVKGWGTYRWDPTENARRFDPLVKWDAAADMLDRESCRLSWFARDRYVPPGKQFQISCLMYHCEGTGSSAFGEVGDPERSDPLLSQPLVETCLRIPTYLAISGGWNRAVARRAFVPDVPAEILRRRWKGMQEGYTAEVFNRNLDFMREMLLNGRLVSQGLLDRHKLESALSGGPSGVLPGMAKISRHVAFEAWLRIWAKQGARLSHKSIVSPTSYTVAC